MASIDKTKVVTYDLARFAGKIGTKQLAFFSLIKITITLSVFFALIMLLVR